MKKYFLYSFLLLFSIAIVNGCKDLGNAIPEQPLSDNSVIATINGVNFEALGDAFKDDNGVTSTITAVMLRSSDTLSLQIEMNHPTTTGSAQGTRLTYVIHKNGMDTQYNNVSSSITLTEITPKFKGTFSGQVKSGSTTLSITGGEFNVNN